LASSEEWRANSKTEPWYRFVPDFVEALIWATVSYTSDAADD
jgi:hypothetical protein